MTLSAEWFCNFQVKSTTMIIQNFLSDNFYPVLPLLTKKFKSKHSTYTKERRKLLILIIIITIIYYLYHSSRPNTPIFRNPLLYYCYQIKHQIFCLQRFCSQKEHLSFLITHKASSLLSHPLQSSDFNGRSKIKSTKSYLYYQGFHVLF